MFEMILLIRNLLKSVIRILGKFLCTDFACFYRSVDFMDQMKYFFYRRPLLRPSRVSSSIGYLTQFDFVRFPTQSFEFRIFTHTNTM